MISFFLFFITCLRCGRCCYYVLDGKTKKCKHLVRLSNKKTLCRIYKQRLISKWEPLKIDKGITKIQYCIAREKDKRIFKGCPYEK